MKFGNKTLIKKINLLYYTLRYLKARQILFRVYYVTRNKSYLWNDVYKEAGHKTGLKPVHLKTAIAKPQSYTTDTFSFLNLDKQFSGDIDWNYDTYGKLWTYNLNYFDYLNQASISKQEGLALIYNYIRSEPTLIVGKEAYPTSLRLINWLKFVYRHQINDRKINDFMLCDLHNLNRNVEYHLMANHLLENAIALTIGGYCLNQQRIYEKGKKLLEHELSEQLCDDGGHYEKSVMYHQILLDRLLDCLNFMNGRDDDHLLRKSITMMCSWLNKMTLSDGSIPHFNDSVPGMAPETAELKKYASTFGINTEEGFLKDSGYRKFNFDKYELIIDGGNIGPTYQAGHGHNDAGSYVLYIRNAPFIIDTATSTYEANNRRAYERSVRAHNTTHPEEVEPSEIWGSFRIARREVVDITNESTNSIEITRILPYKKKYTLVRTFNCGPEIIELSDYSKNQGNYIAYLHFAPHLHIKRTDSGISTDEAELFIENADSFSLDECKVASGFNQLKASKKLTISYSDKMNMQIKIKLRE